MRKSPETGGDHVHAVEGRFSPIPATVFSLARVDASKACATDTINGDRCYESGKIVTGSACKSVPSVDDRDEQRHRRTGTMLNTQAECRCVERNRDGSLNDEMPLASFQGGIAKKFTRDISVKRCNEVGFDGYAMWIWLSSRDVHRIHEHVCRSPASKPHCWYG